MGVLPIHARLFHQEPFFDHPCDLTCHEAQWMGANHQYRLGGFSSWSA